MSQLDSVEPPLRPTYAEIDLGALKNNFKYLHSLSPRSKCMAAVKANAYGHGLRECCLALDSAGVDAFCVALGEEGIELRKFGIKKPILVFGGIFTEQLEPFVEAGLTLTGSSIGKLEHISASARRLNTKAAVHLKIDTGMGRIGVRPESALALFRKAHQLDNIIVEGVFTHFAEADGSENAFTRQQLASFLETRTSFHAIFGDRHPALFHAANSAAVLRYPETHLDMIRPGLSLYGIAPSYGETHAKNLVPVLSLYSKVGYFKVVKKGQSVSYGRTWFAEEDTRIITVPIGYGDGYQRALSNKAQVIVHDKRHPVVGRICMDQLMVSVGNDEAYVGDVVTLIGGKERSTAVRVEEVAEWAGTIPYEILVSLNNRVPRIYKN